jgi:hypothetical protein
MLAVATWAQCGQSRAGRAVVVGMEMLGLHVDARLSLRTAGRRWPRRLGAVNGGAGGAAAGDAHVDAGYVGSPLERRRHVCAVGHRFFRSGVGRAARRILRDRMPAEGEPQPASLAVERAGGLDDEPLVGAGEEPGQPRTGSRRLRARWRALRWRVRWNRLGPLAARRNRQQRQEAEDGAQARAGARTADGQGADLRAGVRRWHRLRSRTCASRRKAAEYSSGPTDLAVRQAARSPATTGGGIRTWVAPWWCRGVPAASVPTAVRRPSGGGTAIRKKGLGVLTGAAALVC